MRNKMATHWHKMRVDMGKESFSSKGSYAILKCLEKSKFPFVTPLVCIRGRLNRLFYIHFTGCFLFLFFYCDRKFCKSEFTPLTTWCRPADLFTLTYGVQETESIKGRFL